MDSRDKFAQMLREGYETLDPEKEQREYIRELLRQKEQQRKRRIKTITAVAAAFLIVVGAVLAVGGCFGAVEADKNDRTKVEEHNGSAVIKGENTEDEEIGPEVAKVTDWDGIAELKEQYPEMITFTDIPEGMEFVSVEVKEESFGMIIATYCYEKNNDMLYVCHRYYLDKKLETQIVENDSKIKSYNGYEVYFNETDGCITANIPFNNGDLCITGRTSEKEIYNILDRIQAS